MNSALTPEKRPDKNGKLVTRHVKTGPSAGLSGRSIPAPQGSVPSREKVTDDIAKLLTPDEGRRGDMIRQSTVLTLNKVKSASLLREVHGVLNDPERSRYMYSLIDSVLSYDGDKAEDKLKVFCASDRFFQRLEEYGFNMPSSMQSDLTSLYAVTFNQHYFRGPVTDAHVDYFKAELFAKKMQMSVNNYPIPHEYYREVEMVKQNLSRIEENAPVLMQAFSKRYDAMHYGEMEAVCDKVESSGHLPEDIADLMRERDVQDVERALLMMDDTAKPLYSGVL